MKIKDNLYFVNNINELNMYELNKGDTIILTSKNNFISILYFYDKIYNGNLFIFCNINNIDYNQFNYSNYYEINYERCDKVFYLMINNKPIKIDNCNVNYNDRILVPYHINLLKSSNDIKFHQKNNKIFSREEGGNLKEYQWFLTYPLENNFNILFHISKHMENKVKIFIYNDNENIKYRNPYYSSYVELLSFYCNGDALFKILKNDKNTIKFKEIYDLINYDVISYISDNKSKEQLDKMSLIIKKNKIKDRYYMDRYHVIFKNGDIETYYCDKNIFLFDKNIFIKKYNLEKYGYIDCYIEDYRHTNNKFDVGNGLSYNYDSKANQLISKMTDKAARRKAILYDIAINITNFKICNNGFNSKDGLYYKDGEKDCNITYEDYGGRIIEYSNYQHYFIKKYKYYVMASREEGHEIEDRIEIMKKLSKKEEEVNDE